jgi:acetyltransferase-like isoleucine patch superfamily enzyme
MFIIQRKMLNRFLRKYKMNTADGRDRTVIFPRINGSLQLGKYSLASEDAEVRCFRMPKVVKVGKYCSLGRCYFAVDGNHNPSYASTYTFAELGVCWKAPQNQLEKALPTVGNDVWIGDDAYVLSGVHIGDGAIIGSNTIVTKNVEPYSVCVGNPGRIVKYRFEPDMIERFMAVQWWDLPDRVVVEELAPLIADPMAFLAAAERHGGVPLKRECVLNPRDGL